MIHTRSTELANPDGRTLLGRALLYDTPSNVTDDGRTRYLEEFAPSSTAKTIKERTFSLLALHAWSPGARTSPIPLGPVTFRSSDEGLNFEARLSKTTAGDEMLELINDGLMRGVSIGFRSIRDSKLKANHIRREEIAISELSICPPELAQSVGAGIEAVRSMPDIDELERMRMRLRLLLIP